jgi:glycosyltransferase involved in cell wall biosynthesis
MSLGQEPLVTVLTSVYNGEDFWAQCIESVLAQMFRTN